MSTGTVAEKTFTRLSYLPLKLIRASRTDECRADLGSKSVYRLYKTGES